MQLQHYADDVMHNCTVYYERVLFDLRKAYKIKANNGSLLSSAKQWMVRLLKFPLEIDNASTIRARHRDF